MSLLATGLFKSHDLPENTLFQFTLWGSPYIEPFLNHLDRVLCHSIAFQNS
jgi:hypothetical protein